MNYFKSIFKSKMKVTDEHIQLDIKGQQLNINPKEFNQYTFKNDLKISKGPEMFNSKIRLKMWAYMGMFFVYCYLLSKLMLFRLKADDLDIMEKEVKSEFEIKRKLKDFNK